jgi:hypothetical protein
VVSSSCSFEKFRYFVENTSAINGDIPSVTKYPRLFSDELLLPNRSLLIYYLITVFLKNQRRKGKQKVVF